MTTHSHLPLRCQAASACVLSLIWLSVPPAEAQTTRTWTGSNSSDWSDGNNWSPAGVPGSGDTAIISSGSVILTNDVLVKSVTLSGGTLGITNGSLTTEANAALSGGTVSGGRLVATNGASLIVNGGGTLDGVTVNGVLDVGDSYWWPTLTVTNGLVLNGTALVGGPTNNSNLGGINFAGTQTLSGNGTVVFGQYDQADEGWYNFLRLANAGATLTIGPGITVRGQNGVIGPVSGTSGGGPTNVTIINQGTISADVARGTITIDAQLFTNNGVTEALNGGTLNVNGSFDNNGFIGVSGIVNLPGPSGGSTLTFGPPPAYFFGPGLVRLTPPAITAQPQSLVAGSGGTAAFSVTATGTGLFYQWQFDGTNLPGATDSTLFFGNVNSTLAGSYSVVVSNLLGSINSAAVTLAVVGTGVTPANINSTWTAADSPYVAGTNFTANNLVIQPGVSVLFNGAYSLTVTGLLQAVGSSNNPIIFSGTSPGAGWQGIRFVSADTNGAMNWCVVRGAAAAFTPIRRSCCKIAASSTTRRSMDNRAALIPCRAEGSSLRAGM